MLNDLIDKYILVYMDDIIIYSRSKQCYVQNVNQVFKRLSEDNWHVKSNKFVLFFDKVEFFVHIITKDIVPVADVKVSLVCDWSIPKTMQNIQGYLGLAYLYRWLIRLFAKISELPTSLMKKGTCV